MCFDALNEKIVLGYLNLYMLFVVATLEMMGTKELLELVEKIKLVENLSERELKNPEGAGFDLRVGEVYQLKGGEAFIGITERSTPETELVAQCGREKEYVLKPGEYVLVKTVEKVNLPQDLAAHVYPRTTLHRSGVLLRTAPVSPGYCGELTFGMYNIGPLAVRFELGARLFHIQFSPTGENVSVYRGQWQGGRVSTEGKKEMQV